MFLEIFLGGAVVYGLTHHSPFPKLTEAITLPKLASFEKIKIRFFDPFFTDSRKTHQKNLNGGTAPGLSDLEKTRYNKIVLMTGSLTVAGIAALTTIPGLYLFSTVPVIYFWFQILPTAYHSLVHQRKVDLEVLTVVLLVGALAGGMYFELAFGTWLYCITMYLVAKTEDHSQSSLVNLFGEQPRFVHSLLDGVELQIPLEEVQVGRILVVQAGEMIPVDGRVLQGTAVVDQHMLTGEAQPLEKTTGDLVFTATVVLAGQLQVETTQTGPQTVAAQVSQILSQTSDFKANLQSRAKVFIDQASLPTLMISAVTWATVGFNQALGVLYTYPGYPVLILNPLSMLGHLHLASQKGILIKDGRSLELLDQVDTFVFDKTGTLTLEQPQISQIHAWQGFTPLEVLQFAALAERKQSHPIAQAILQAAQEQALELPPVEEASYQLGFGIKVSLNGKMIRVGSQRFLAQEGLTLPPEIEAVQTRCHQVGHTLVLVACDTTLMGGLELQATIRPEAQTVIQQLKAQGFKLVIISGDHPEPTQYLAAFLGIESYYAQVLPEAKANLVAQLEAQGQKVCFVGDGINDALALKKATCSVSLRGATTIATDTAQIVLMEANLNQLVCLLELAKGYNKNIKVNFIISISYSALYITGAYLFGWPLLVAILIEQSTSLIGLYNVLQPLIKEEDYKDLPLDEMAYHRKPIPKLNN